MFPAFNVQTFFLFNSVLNGMFPTSLCRGILPGARVVAWKYATQTTKNWRFQSSVDGQRFAVQTIRQCFFTHNFADRVKSISYGWSPPLSLSLYRSHIHTLSLSLFSLYRSHTHSLSLSRSHTHTISLSFSHTLSLSLVLTPTHTLSLSLNSNLVEFYFWLSGEVWNWSGSALPATSYLLPARQGLHDAYIFVAPDKYDYNEINIRMKT